MLVKSYSISHGHHGKSFVLGFFKVSIDHLFDNLECEKRNYCFGKSLEFWMKNLYEPRANGCLYQERSLRPEILPP